MNLINDANSITLVQNKSGLTLSLQHTLSVFLKQLFQFHAPLTLCLSEGGIYQISQTACNKFSTGELPGAHPDHDLQLQESSAKLTNQRVSYAFSPFSFHSCHILPASKFQYSYSY